MPAPYLGGFTIPGHSNPTANCHHVCFIAQGFLEGTEVSPPMNMVEWDIWGLMTLPLPHP